MKYINWNQISELGLIERINREILHPLGLAVSRDVETGHSTKILVADDGVWEYTPEMKTTVLPDSKVKELLNKMVNHMITRKEYLQDSTNLHHAYFSQFVTDSVKQRVARVIGVDRIKASKDKYFNDIPLSCWDRMFPIYSGPLLKELGESNTISTTVCIAKTAARIIKEEN